MLIPLRGKRKIVARGECQAETKSRKAVEVGGTEQRGARQRVRMEYGGAGGERQNSAEGLETEITKLRLSNSLSPEDERNDVDDDAYGFSREHRRSRLKLVDGGTGV